MQKEYKTRHDWVEKVIHWELCKKLKFDHTNKWYIHKPESVRENETLKILWEFSSRTLYLEVINKKKKKKEKKKEKENLPNIGLYCPGKP